MAEKQTILTAEGLEKLKAELNELRTVKRLENEERLHEAISHGDLSENSEYDAAKDEQARIEGRIQEIEQMLKTAVVIDNSKKRKSEVELGTTVTIEDLAPEFEEDKIQEYTVVGTTEADPFAGKISNESPIGAAIMGKKVGTVVTVRTPLGDHQFKIKKIK
ncbi:MAG: Transcription elongation factor GreA [Succiniclasticum sp.]|jgi:transcription elongation factor GreA